LNVDLGSYERLGNEGQMDVFGGDDPRVWRLGRHLYVYCVRGMRSLVSGSRGIRLGVERGLRHLGYGEIVLVGLGDWNLLIRVLGWLLEVVRGRAARGLAAVASELLGHCRDSESGDELLKDDQRIGNVPCRSGQRARKHAYSQAYEYSSYALYSILFLLLVVAQ
jgi:hypothetical protein